MNLTSLPQYARNAKRFRNIVYVFAKYGLAEWVRDMDSEFVSSLFRGPAGEDLRGLPAPERLRRALSELGTTFIKLGQILSTRSDLVGEEWAHELARLQSNAPADPPAVVRQILEVELGAPVGELFQEFAEAPLGSASVGQVHLARLRDGRPVVVKVQHPGIEEIIVQDLDILMALADLAERSSSELRLYQPKAVLEAFRRQLLHELDFQRERDNLERFRRNFAGQPEVHFPEPIFDHSTRRVLTMEQLHGRSLEDPDRLIREGARPAELADRCASMYLDMIFRDRFYHADPHAGNLLLLPGGVLGVLDCGMVGRLDQASREVFEDLMLAFVSDDIESLTNAALALGAAPPDLDRDRLQCDIAMFLEDYADRPLASLDLSDMLLDLTRIVRRHRIVQRPEISLLSRAIILLEGTLRRLQPTFHLVGLIQEYATRRGVPRMGIERTFRRLLRSRRDWDRFLHLIPREGADILQRIRTGKLDVQLEHHRLDSVINRLVFGILAASLFVGSSLLLSAKVPPTLFGISILGALGIAAALFLSVLLIWAVYRSGGLDASL